MKKAFLDTNVLIHANDARDPGKQARAIEVVTDCMRHGTGVISTQVLQEYAVVAIGKLTQDLEVVLQMLLEVIYLKNKMFLFFVRLILLR